GFVGLVFRQHRRVDREPGHYVERRRDHPAVQDAARGVADQFGLHVETQLWFLGVEGFDLEPQHLVEGHEFLEEAPQAFLAFLPVHGSISATPWVIASSPRGVRTAYCRTPGDSRRYSS